MILIYWVIILVVTVDLPRYGSMYIYRDPLDYESEHFVSKEEAVSSSICSAHRIIPINNPPHHSTQYGYHIPPPLVDPISGITYVPYYPAVSISSPYPTHPLAFSRSSESIPAIQSYTASTPLYSWHQNNVVELRKPHQGDSMMVPWQSDNSHFTLDPSQTHFPAMDGRMIVENTPSKQIEQKTVIDKNHPPLLETKINSENGQASVSDLKKISDRTQNKIEEHNCSELNQRKNQRPFYSPGVNSSKHVDHIIAAPVNVGGVSEYLDDSREIIGNTCVGPTEKVSGKDWVSPKPQKNLPHTSAIQSNEQQSTHPAHNICKPWLPEKEHDTKISFSGLSGKNSGSTDIHNLRISQETLDMDLWICKLKEAEGYLKFHTRKDLYNLEDPKKELISDTFDHIPTEKKASASVEKVVAKPFPVLVAPTSNQDIWRKKIKTKAYTPQWRNKNYVYVKKDNLKPPTIDMRQDKILSNALKGSTLRSKGKIEVEVERVKKITDKQIENIPDGKSPPEKIVKKAELPGKPLIEKISQEENTRERIEKYNEFNQIEKNSMVISFQSPEKIPEERKRQVNSNTKANDILKDDNESNFLSKQLGFNKPVSDKNTFEVLEHSDIKEIKDKFIVPSSIKSSKRKKKSNIYETNAKIKVASKGQRRNTADLDKETTPLEMVSWSNHGILRILQKFPDQNLLDSLKKIPSMQKYLTPLWIWKKPEPEPTLSKTSKLWIPTWASKDYLSSKSTSSDSPDTQTKTPMTSFHSNPGFSNKLTAKISDLKHSFGCVGIPLIQPGVDSLWGWMKKTPEPMWRRAKEFWYQRQVGENTKEVYHDEVLEGHVLKANTKGGKEYQVDKVETRPSKDLSDISEKQMTEGVQKQDQEQDQNLSLNSKSKADVKKKTQSFTAQRTTGKKFNHISREKPKKRLSASDREVIQYYSSILRLTNKKELLPIDITEDEYQLVNPLNVNKDLYDLMKQNSKLSVGEFARRLVAMECQINQFRMAKMIEDQGDLISQRMKKLLSLFQSDVPWATFPNLSEKELRNLSNEIEDIYKEPSDVEDLKAIMGSEFKIRKKIISYLLKRKPSSEWWDEEKLQLGRKQGLDIVTVLGIGDILEFGEPDIGKTSLLNMKEVPKKMETLYEKFLLRKNALPWHDSPERAWLESQPEVWKLYQERFEVIILSSETLNSSHVYRLFSNDGRNNQHAWWKFGDYLMWIDEGIDHLPIPDIGESLKLGKNRLENAKRLTSVKWNTKLERYDHETKRKIHCQQKLYSPRGKQIDCTIKFSQKFSSSQKEKTNQVLTMQILVN
ncbi:hypothetical protein DFH28DRAFT_318811 [Melampsora americana]|nr:hypothetical protein DFH28DRAFT_318811 [Melampsora americana]